jgi:hypothetical protein
MAWVAPVLRYAGVWFARGLGALLEVLGEEERGVRGAVFSLDALQLRI